MLVVKTLHDVFTLLAVGILLGGGGTLAWIAVRWPWANNVVSGAALVICILIVLIAALLA